MTLPALHRLSGSLGRVARAEKHFADLGRLIAEEVGRPGQSAFTPQFDPEPPHQFRLVNVSLGTVAVHVNVGIVLGEILYNLRSALDYLVFELAKLDSGSEQEDTQFPIVDSAQNFNGGVDRWLKGVNPSHRAAIERLQPYRGCRWTKALRDFSNRDKHREFVRLGAHLDAQGANRLDDPDFDRFLAPIRRAPHPVHGEVDVKVDITVEVQFFDGTAVMRTLNEIKTGVADTLRNFYAEF